MQQRSQAAIIVQRIPRLAIPNETRVARFNLGDGAFVFVAVEINVVALAHQPVEHAPPLGEPLHGLDARGRGCLALGQLVPLPRLQVLVGLAQAPEATAEDEADRLIDGVRALARERA